MQTSGLYASPPLHPLYHHPYHHVLPGPQDHELKKQYLSLLPPQHIIDICLNFDLHAPLYVKSTIWPADINAAIAAIQKSCTETPVASSSTSNGEKAATDSSKESSQPPSAVIQSIEQSAEAQPPDKPSSPAPDTSQTSAQSQTTEPTPSTPATAAAAAPQQPPYPHQPYGYGHPQAAYPHAPYYQAPPGYPPYPSPYPYPLPGQYPQPHPTFSQPASVPYAPPPPHPTHAPPQPRDVFVANPTSTDDLPSYEEMIAEALTDSADPEGCAPKDLFTWMAARYPLQQNFRPSASQALQKAFKRGRFIKSSNGKYRLNATWEGGATSRRTTRRPQTQNPTSASPAPPSPFTHAPLVHHNQPSQAPAFQTQPYGYPFQQPPQGFPGYARPGQTQTTPVASTSATTATTSTSDASQATSVQDAWEAAQNILKAINFDTLLSLPKEESNNLEPNQPSVGPYSTVPPSTSGPSASDVPHNTADTTGAVTDTEDYSAGRAELQAHLALLAAQLAELSQEDEGDPVIHYPVVTSPSAPPPSAATWMTTAAPPPPTVPVTASIVPPMASIPLPLPLPPPPQPQSQLQSQTQYAMPLYTTPADLETAQQHAPPIPMPTAPPAPLPPPVEVIPTEEEEDSDDDDDDMEAVI